MKYAFVTGAAGGLAAACIEELVKRGGWTIFAAGRTEATLNALAEQLGDCVIPVATDISDADSVAKMVETVKKYTDHIDVIVNAAGVHTMASLVEPGAAETMEFMIRINIMGMIRVNEALFPLLSKGSRIINFSSECGWEQPQPFNSPYAITKWAIEAYTIGLRRELLFLDIPVIKIQPGSFKTNMHGQANAGYAKLLKSTKYYKPVLTVLSPLMTVAMSSAHDKKYLVEGVMDAIYSKKPKRNYKIKNTWYLGLIDPIPPFIIDPAYKYFVGGLYKVMKLLGKG
ncbi:MAG: SDR family NAD(P)-dependent oxidoreductase [Clostridia bacterium]|nr:SDR family NAD(P)-dependent oxidoreductase [Clostridia bacterium]